MQMDFGLFPERLEKACRARDLPLDALCHSTGLGSDNADILPVVGVKALGIFELAQIAGTLDVSIDWLLGRTNVMDVPGMPDD